MITTRDVLASPAFERVTTMTPLGIRFWDSARNAQVTSGLRVTARPVGEPGARPTPAFVTASGNYAFSGLPGLREFEFPPAGSPDPAFPPPGPAKSFWIDVVDPAGEFVAVTFTAPAPTKGLLLQNTPSPPPGFFLFSASSRRTGPEIAAVRGDLIDKSTGLPAAFAVVEVDVPGQGTVLGTADEQGRVVVMFPYPTVVRSIVPGPVPPASWALTIRVRYAPAALKFVPLPPLSAALAPVGARPELGSMLAQTVASIISTDGGVATTSLAAQLTVRQELILRTEGHSELLIQSA